MYEKEILEELKKINKRLEETDKRIENLEYLLLWDDKFGSMNFRNCLARIMRGVD